MHNYEKLGAFYLGKSSQPGGEEQGELLLYDSKDLTTHAVIVGMTGSGKTGLGVTLLEEAAIDGIPALIIDPKGDMGNLLLSFPQLRPEDFRPWCTQDEATRKGMSLEEYAADRAALWQRGLGEWEQGPDRIQRFRDSAETAIYTPGSDAGLPLSVLKSLDAPPQAVRESLDALRERVSGAASGLCTLLGIDADPIRSREHILLSNILDHAWREGKNLDLAGLIYEIQTPSVRKIGVMDVDQIFPPNDRMKLAMTLNNVLAAPGFAAWMHGEPLNIQRLLYTPEGKPKLSVLSIAHLPERERMFFVTILLNEVIAWMRAQPGTSSLRAIVYMDEVFGYLPPTANPPSKTPLLTLLKQARAYGVGLVLATQNPVDLDYKALSNAGTWFLGRLQTERDKLRVLDGLEGASASAGHAFDRAEVDRILSAVGNRVFLLNNVHEDHPELFQTRWALSYLSGPMTRQQIETLMAPRKAAAAPTPGAVSPSTAVVQQGPIASEGRPPVLPASIEQRYVPLRRSVPRDAAIEYRPALLGSGRLHFVDSKSKLDLWKDILRLCPVSDETPASPWDEADVLDSDPPAFESAPIDGAAWAELPSELTKASSYTSWKTRLKDALYQSERLELQFSPLLDRYSQPGATAGDFRAALRQAAREERDLQVEKLRSKYASKLQRQEEAIQRAEHRVGAEAEQAKGASLSAWLSTGTSLLGALFGRKKISVTNISRAGTAARAHTRASQQKADITRAQAKLEDEREELAELEAELQSEIDELDRVYRDDALELEAYEIRPRKSDISVNSVALCWMPWLQTAAGLEPAWEMQPQ